MNDNPAADWWGHAVIIAAHQQQAIAVTDVRKIFVTLSSRVCREPIISHDEGAEKHQLTKGEGASTSRRGRRQGCINALEPCLSWRAIECASFLSLPG